jgi:hypothetical protein
LLACVALFHKPLPLIGSPSFQVPFSRRSPAGLTQVPVPDQGLPSLHSPLYRSPAGEIHQPLFE